MKFISSVDNKWGIGRDGDLLFFIPEDMRRFKNLTTGNIVIMGRKTLQSLPGGRPLKDRDNIVLTRDASFQVEGAKVVHSPEALFLELKASAYAGKEVYVIGGGQIFALLLPYAKESLITHIHATLEADSYFPNLSELPEWEMQELSGWMEHEGIAFAYATYINTAVKEAIS